MDFFGRGRSRPLVPALARLAALDAIMHMGPSAKKYSTSVMSVMEELVGQ